MSRTVTSISRALRLFGYVALLYFIYRETGPFTTISIFLIGVMAEMHNWAIGELSDVTKFIMEFTGLVKSKEEPPKGQGSRF